MFKPEEMDALKKQDIAEAEANSHKAPKANLGGKDGGGQHDVKGGSSKQGDKKDDQKGDKKDGASPQQEQRGSLPGHVTDQFKDSNLSDVSVIRNSEEAGQRGVQGFASHDTIHLAPGADEHAVLRHEAAHVVQFRNHKQGQQPDSKAENELKADAAEAGAPQTKKQVGSAPVGEVRNKDEKDKKEGGGGPDDKGAPHVNFNGMSLAGVSGSFKKSILEAESGPWKDGIKLWDVHGFWPFPAFPIAGVDIGSEGKFSPKAELAAEGSYAWKKEEKTYELEGALKGSVGVGISASVLGGVALGALGIEVGVGVEATGSISLTASAEKKISLSYNYEKNTVACTLTPLEINIGGSADLKLAVGAFFRHWGKTNKKMWTFASFRVATFEGFKWPIAITFATDGIKADAKPVVKGTFSWGSPPATPGEGGAQGGGEHEPPKQVAQNSPPPATPSPAPSGDGGVCLPDGSTG